MYIKQISKNVADTTFKDKQYKTDTSQTLNEEISLKVN